MANDLSIQSTRPKWLTVTLWIAQILCGAMFLFAGSGKLAGGAQFIAAFDAIGFGQWFRYLTGGLEVLAGILLLIPSKAVYGAVLLVCVMAGAVLTHLVRLPGSAAPAAFLLVLGLFILWGRRKELPVLAS